MTLEEIRWIATLYETGNMSTAAKKLYVSQSALSQCLQRVEKQLGFQLFTRVSKKLYPTESAALFYEMANSIGKSYETFREQAAVLNQESIRKITIGLTSYLSYRVFNRLIAALNKAHPEMTFAIFEGPSDELEEALRKNRIQLAVTRHPLLFEGMNGRKLCDVNTVLFLRAGSMLEKKAYVVDGVRYLDPVHLKEEPIGMIRAGQASNTIAWNLFEECGIRPNLISEAPSYGMLSQYAETGICSSVCAQSPNIHPGDPAAKRMYRIPPKYQWSKAPVMLYTTPEYEQKIPDDIYAIMGSIIPEGFHR